MKNYTKTIDQDLANARIATDQLSTNNEVLRNDIEKLVLDLQPTVECYNEVIRAWSNTHKPIIARTERWLDTLRRNREYHNKSARNNDLSQKMGKLYISVFNSITSNP